MPILIHGAEIWTITKRQEEKLTAIEINFFGRSKIKLGKIEL